MERKFCQSCGMPMDDASLYGTDADGAPNEDYCRYCFQDGQFVQSCTMEEMIERCAQFVEEFNKGAETKMTRDEAVAQMKQFFPHLKRWKDAASGN